MDECIAGAITPQCGNTFDANNAMTAFGSQPLGYDLNGNLTNDGSNTYQWNARNHLSSMTGVTNASFTYDGAGRRAGKTINGTTTQFTYDRLNPVQELDGSTNVTANLLTGLNIDEYFSRTDVSGQMNFLTDMLGSTLGLTDLSGTLDTQYSYDPFGNTIASGTSSGNPYQYAGRENDDAGLYYYRARYYNPSLQRFISQDPLGFAGGDVNAFTYAHNRPTFYSDPFGEAVHPHGPSDPTDPTKLILEIVQEWAQGQAGWREFGPESGFARDLNHSPGVLQALKYFLSTHGGQCKRGDTTTDYKYDFDTKDYIKTLNQPTEQFLGSYRVDIQAVEDGVLEITVTNPTSVSSLFHYATRPLQLPDVPSPKKGPFSTIHERIPWTCRCK
ncbi:MAG TPA: RHS repeat-associated core domain-containing protein [Candidatus Binataceae bacterium]|nr:RHS repeat-associated core domain-containing protein [Candidatus Binataceae bacterium]